MDTSETGSSTSTPAPTSVYINDREPLSACCKDTIDMHAANNPMMVCAECKQIIKYFDDERAFRNYCAFCVSRHRPIQAAKYKDIFVVVFRSHDVK